MPNSIRILLIDDHILVREAIARLVAAEPGFRVVGQAGTTSEGLDILSKTQVDIVLLDVNLDVPATGSFVELARAADFSGKVLLVTAGVSKIQAANLLRAGCSGIFLKHEPPVRLIERIRALAQGEESAGPPDQGTLEKYEGNSVLQQPLTPREREVLRGVFAGKSNKELAFELSISESFVKSILHDIFHKTGVRSRAQLVRVGLEKYWRDLE